MILWEGEQRFVQIMFATACANGPLFSLYDEQEASRMSLSKLVVQAGFLRQDRAHQTFYTYILVLTLPSRKPLCRSGRDVPHVGLRRPKKHQHIFFLYVHLSSKSSCYLGVLGV